jgi:hypothetical protein
LKRGWMRFWRSVSVMLLLGLPGWAQQTPVPKNNAAGDSAPPHRLDELTLARLRPGRDDIGKAQRLFSKPTTVADNGTAQTWRDACRHELLSIVTDPAGTILEVRVGQSPRDSRRECASPAPSPWITGHGLFVGDSCSRALALYGQPNSRGPSTKDGHQLELLYYAFDWAGPDVPQLMVVLCTPEKDGKPGRVVELTLDALSL